MDLHEELERRARLASAAAASRLGATGAGDALVALVGRRRRRRAQVVTGASAACVAAIVGVVAYVGQWSLGPVSPAAPTPTATGTAVIDESTPLADAPFSFPRYLEKEPLACGEAYDVPSGATRQTDDASRWPVTVTASAVVNSSDAGALGLGEDLLAWTTEAGPRAAMEDLALTAYAVVEYDGRVAASKPLASQEPAGGGVMDMLNAPVPGLCGEITADVPPEDGEYTFHLWVQLVDGAGTPVATVVDPVAPVTLNVTGIAEYWNKSTTFNGYPNLSVSPIKCGDPSSAEGHLWDDAGYSETLPEGVTMPEWSASMTDGVIPGVHAWLGEPLLPDSVAVAQAFGVVNGVVVAVGPVGVASDALNYYASFDLSSPCGVSAQSWMDMYVLQEAVITDGSNAPPVEGAVVFKLGPVAVVPTVAAIGPVAPPTISLADAPPLCGDEWSAEPSVVLHNDTASRDVTGVFLEPSSTGSGWDVGLGWADNVRSDVSWLSASYAVAEGRVVGVAAAQSTSAYALDGATVPEADPASCSGGAVGEVTQHVVIQAVRPQNGGGPSVPVATWVDPFGP